MVAEITVGMMGVWTRILVTHLDINKTVKNGGKNGGKATLWEKYVKKVLHFYLLFIHLL